MNGTIKIAFLDWEFIPINPLKNELVCVNIQYADKSHDFWVFRDMQAQNQARVFFEQLKTEGYILCGFYINAEANCLRELGLEPLDFQWLDCHIIGLPFYHSAGNYREMALRYYAPPVESIPLNLSIDEEEEFIEKRAKMISTKSILGYLKYFCGEEDLKLDIIKKQSIKMVLGLINAAAVSLERKTKIQEYCKSDVDILRRVCRGQIDAWKARSKQKMSEIFPRFLEWSRYRVQMLDISRNGLPLNRETYLDLIQYHDKYVEAEYLKNPLFYEFIPEKRYKKDGKWGKKGQIREPQRYKESEELFERWLQQKRLMDEWPRTEKGKYRTAEEVLKTFDVIPEIEQYLSSKKQIKQIQFFKIDIETKKPKIAEHVTIDSDGNYWQHPDFGTFGTLTGRNAHLARSFIMAFERSLRPKLLGCPKDYTVLQPDFSAEEVCIGGYLSGDLNQLKATKEDPYLDFGRHIGLIPADGTKKSHAKERDNICKPCVLAAGFYGMGLLSLRNKLQMELKKVEHYYWEMKSYYRIFNDWQRRWVYKHQRTQYAELCDGWASFDNTDKDGNFKSTTAKNFPVQGTGAAILRKVVDLFYARRHLLPSKKIRLIYTLHDEFGVLTPEEYTNETTRFMTQIMQDACRFYFPQYDPPRVGFK